MADSETPKKEGLDLIKSILREAEEPMTTRELQAEVRKVITTCPTASVVVLNILRIAGAIKGKRSGDRKAGSCESRTEPSAHPGVNIIVYLSILRQRRSQSPLSLSVPLDVITISSQIPVLRTSGIVVLDDSIGRCRQ